MFVLRCQTHARTPFRYTVTTAAVQAAGFPPRSFGVERFDAMLVRSGGAANILTLDVSTVYPPDTSIPAQVVGDLGLARASRFEIGNEVSELRMM
jgi:hypothetical protein